MRLITWTASATMGLLLGLFLYAALAHAIPGVNGTLPLLVVLSGGVIVVVLGTGRAAAPLTLDGLARFDVTTVRLTGVVARCLAAWLIAALILAAAAPLLEWQGIGVHPAVRWLVFGAALLVCFRAASTPRRS